MLKNIKFSSKFESIFVTQLYRSLPVLIEGVLTCNNLPFILVKSKNIVKILLVFLKHYNCSFLVDILATDVLASSSRFHLDYVIKHEFFSALHAYKQQYQTNVVLRIIVPYMASALSITGIFNSANSMEREIWDMFGIYFTLHPNLRRILTDYGFQGHPFKKDFPLSGYVETRYDTSLQRVVLEPVELAQEFRSFDFLNPWV